MIDYEKLKIFHDACINTDFYISVEVGHKNGIYYNLMSRCDYGKSLLETQSEEDLLTKLESLTQPKPKYEVGQTVSWTFHKTIYSGQVEFHCKDTTRYQINAACGPMNLDEDQLHPTKQALIKAQILHWQNELIKEFHPPFEGEVKAFNYFTSDSEETCIPCCKFCSFTLDENLSCSNLECEGTVTRKLSSCCSVHTGTTEECLDGDENMNNLRCSFCDRALKECRDCPIKSCPLKPDIQSNQDEVDLHGCQHESMASTYGQKLMRCIKCLDVYTDGCQHESDGISGPAFVDGCHYKHRCKKCGEFYR